MSQTAELLEHLQTAIAGLQWMSESDYPFQVVHWPAQPLPLLPEQLLALLDRDPETPVETVELDRFFEWVTQAQDWHSPEERATVQQYRTLKDLLQQLRDVQVYQVGSINLDIYILGRSPTGAVIGVTTQAVET